MSRIEYILGCFLVLCGLLGFVNPAFSAGNTAQPNFCVQCHSKLSESSFYGAKSHSWIGSIHQQHGVTCNMCHGGNPAATQEKQAHIGVLGSSNPHSPIYYKNIPATCGKCHGAEYYKFKQSVPYHLLQTTGRGPDCVTCHGSMVTKVLSPNDMAAVCARCHNPRMGVSPYITQQAKAVLLLIREGNVLLAAEKRLYPAPRSPQVAKTLTQAGIALHNAKLNWHTFHLDAITNYLLTFYDTVQKLPPAPSVSH